MSIGRSRVRPVATSLALFLAACGGDSGGATSPPDNSVFRIDISPSSSVSLASGGTTTLVATAFTKSNKSLGSTSVSWASSNDAVASVAGGVVTAKLAGTATITAALGSVSSGGVTVTVTPGAASQVGVRVQPDGAASGDALTAQPVVEVRDAAGNLVSSSSLAVTVAIASGGGVLAGASTVTTVGGVAAFTGLAITGLVGPRTLSFAAPGVAAATSASFNLAPGAAEALAIRTQPVAGTAYAAFTTPAVVELRDGAGNVTNSTATVTAAIAAGGGTLGGSVSVAAVAGVATFTTLMVNGTAGARTLSFTSGTLTPATTSSFDVAAAPPAVITGPATPIAIAAVAGANPAPTNVTVTNGGVFPLTNLRVQSTTYNPIFPPGWLLATFPSGTDAPATLRLTVTSANLAIGTYTAVVVLAGDGAAATASLTVTLTVNQQFVNTYGTSANKVSIVAIGTTLSPGLVTTTTAGAPVTTDPTVTYASRLPGTATVDATGKVTAVAAGQAWVVANSTQNNADSVMVIVPRASGLILRTDLTKYSYKRGDTITVHIQIDTRGAMLGAATVTFAWPEYVGVGQFGSLALIDINTTASPMSPVTTVDPVVNVVRINGASVAGATGVVELATVRLRVVTAGINTFYVNAIELLGTDFSDLLPTATATQYPVIVP
jgi:hypothetical protein